MGGSCTEWTKHVSFGMNMGFTDYRCISFELWFVLQMYKLWTVIGQDLSYQQFSFYANKWAWPCHVIANHYHSEVQGLEHQLLLDVEKMIISQGRVSLEQGQELHNWLAILLRSSLFLCCFSDLTCFNKNGYVNYDGGWPSARLFGWSAADWSRPATNKSISCLRKIKKRSSALLRKEIIIKVVVDLLQQKRLGCWKVLEKRCKKKIEKCFPNSQIWLSWQNEKACTVWTWWICSSSPGHWSYTQEEPLPSHAAASTFKVCAHKRSLASTDIAHNMFRQVKMKIPWYSSRHMLML